MDIIGYRPKLIPLLKLICYCVGLSKSHTNRALFKLFQRINLQMANLQLTPKLLIETEIGLSIGIEKTKNKRHTLPLTNPKLQNFDCRNKLYDTCLFLLDDTQQPRLCFLNRGLLFISD